MDNPTVAVPPVTRDIVVIGASAGGVEALSSLMRHLPADLPAAVFVVLHISQYGTSTLPAILSRAGKLSARHPEDGEEIQNGVIYVAPSDRHLLIEGSRVRVTRGPRENGYRPSVDPLFRSAARAAGRRVIGVILSGLLDDGTAGLLTIKRLGGMALVQSPDEALFSGMIHSAIEHVKVDHILTVAEIADRLDHLTHEPLPPAISTKESPLSALPNENGSLSREIDKEIDAAKLSQELLDSPDHPGHPSAFSCPDCGGVLWEIPDGELIRFRCRTGHAFTAGTLLAEQSEALDSALWAALRALEESASLAERLANRARERGHNISLARFTEQASEARERAAIIRRALMRPDPVNEGPEPPVS